MLDFMLIIHKHNDHGDNHSRNQMAAHGVKAIAGFELAKPCIWQGKLLSWEFVDEIDCGPKSGNTVIFHMAVGLNIQKALDKLQPEYALFSHAWELAHKVDKYRWTIDDLLKTVHKVTGRDSSRLLYPCWGDKIVYTKKTQSLSSGK